MCYGTRRNKLCGWLVGAACAVLLIPVVAHAQQAPRQQAVTASGQELADTASPTLPVKTPCWSSSITLCRS